MFKKIALALVVVLAAYGIYFVFGARIEATTDIEFPAEFMPADKYCADKEVTALNFQPGQESAIQDALNSLAECTTVNFGAGTYKFGNSVTINGVNGVTLKGAGKEQTTIQFVDAGNGNGVDVESSHSFTIRDLTLIDSPKNGLEIRLSDNIVIDNIKVTWSNTSGPEKSKNGAYGIYPVNVKNVLLQNTDAYYASDAGLYVGQCINAVVRYNTAEHNVMGLEIENTVNADVYENTVQNNTGGLLVYDLNKNTIVTRNIRFHKNVVRNNNNPNFGNAGIVKSVPSGVGFIITSAREVEVFNNVFENNNSVDIAVVSGLVAVTSDFGQWEQNNFRTHSIYIHDNTFNGGSGDSIDNGSTNAKDRPLGVLVEMVYEQINNVRKEKGQAPTDVHNILYDGVDDGKTILALTNTWFGNVAGNHNGICLEKNNGGKIQPSLIDMNLPAVMNNAEDPTPEGIRAAVESGDVRSFDAENNYGGAPDAGFACSGFKAQDVPVKGLGD